MDRRRALAWAGSITMVGSAGVLVVGAVFGGFGVDNWSKPDARPSRPSAGAPSRPPTNALVSAAPGFAAPSAPAVPQVPSPAAGSGSVPVLIGLAEAGPANRVSLTDQPTPPGSAVRQTRTADEKTNHTGSEGVAGADEHDGEGEQDDEDKDERARAEGQRGKGKKSRVSRTDWSATGKGCHRKGCHGKGLSPERAAR